MTSSKVVTKIDARGVATVTLNNPEKHNAFDDAMVSALRATFEKLANDESVRVLVLASEGKSFSAGADLNWMKRMANYSFDENLADAQELAAMLKALNFMPKPTIARVQGAVFGGAVGLVSCCDMAAASPKASFCLSEVKIGLMPATISPYVIAAMGSRAARRYFNTAERFSAETASRLGLVSEVATEDTLDEVISTLIDGILTNSPQAMRASKELVFAMTDRAITDELVRDTCERIAAIRVSDEGQEGLTAFLEKRSPKWISDAGADSGTEFSTQAGSD